MNNSKQGIVSELDAVQTELNALKARPLTAWAKASPTSAGPGNPFHKISQGLKGKNNIRAVSVPPLQGEDFFLRDVDLGLRALRSTPGCHISGFQPADLSELKARNMTAWAGATPTSAGHCLALAGNQPAIPSGLKARHVIAWAEASPTSAGPGQPPP